MSYLASILGVGIVSALLFYFSFKLDEEHFILKLLSLIVAFILLAIIPSFTTQSINNDCDWYVNDTWNNASHTNYDYVQLCGTNTGTANVAFINVYYGFMILFFIYITVFIVLQALHKINEDAILRKKRR